MFDCRMWCICDICGQDMTADEPMVALEGDKSLSSFWTGLRTSFVPDLDPRALHLTTPGPQQLCRWKLLVCNKFHAPCRPGSAVHRECLQVFMRNCDADDALDRLWQTCTWRRVPWTGVGVPELQLRPRPVWHFEDAFVLCAERCGLSLVTLPQVIIGAVLKLLPRDGHFWRCVAALDMARRLSIVTPVQPLQIIPLNRLVSWERGQAPKVASEEGVETLPRLIRLTIDLDGLSSLERLAEWPSYNRKRFDHKAFVVEREDAFGVSLARSKNGLLQLSVREKCEDSWFAVWDTPTPPDLARCLVVPEKPLFMVSYHSIDLAAATGITFFLLGGIFALHAHTRTQPCAMATYHTLQEIWNLESDCFWVYLPLPHGDTVVTCGPQAVWDSLSTAPTRSSCNSFLIRTRLSGETVISRCLPDEGHGEPVASYTFFANQPEQPPTTLLYSTGPGWPVADISAITTCSEQVQAATFEEPWYCPSPSERPLCHHSHAPLENVRQVRVFYWPDTESCMGMLLEYDNGGQRALGQCRLHVSPSRTFQRPSFISFWNIPGYGDRVEVLFDDVPWADEADLDIWCFYAMTGSLDFWFNADTTAISIREGKPIPREEVSGNKCRVLAEALSEFAMS